MTEKFKGESDFDPPAPNAGGLSSKLFPMLGEITIQNRVVRENRVN
jgi:hypothetical protein